ncbi:uncharacterized protein LOC142179986 [Nicotiana tabacum]|uniref:Uncharacterized protein LOC142179986 n=1 Tax=Nicotiana tabacum TaxID=4097 RepID=A0AC58UBY0_TOBAC
MVSAMRNIKDARILRAMRSDSSQRDLNLWCEYHGMNSHQTWDCQHLRQEVVTSLKNGHYRKFLSDRAKNNYGHNKDNAELPKAGEEPPRQMINMIFGGNEINKVTLSAAKKMKVSITHSKRLQEDDITFTEEDADKLLLPDNDTLVISLNVLDYKIRRCLVDLGSSANIIQWRVLEQTKLTGSIIPAIKLLAGFNLASVTTREEILLLINAEGVMKTTLFEVVDGDMGLKTTNSQSMALPNDNEAGLQDENNNLTTGYERPLVDPIGTRVADPIDVNSHVAIEANQCFDPENSIHGGN